MEEEEIPEADIIDDALAELIEEIIGDEGDIEEFDAASDVVMDMLEQLANEGLIVDPPESEASEEEKKEWLGKYLSIVDERIHKALHDGFLGDASEEI